MKYWIALAAILGEFIVFWSFNALIGWEHGGGALIMMLRWAAYAATWRAIVKKGKKKDESSGTND